MKLFLFVALGSLAAQAPLQPDPMSMTTMTELFKQVPALVVMGMIVRMFLQHMDRIDLRKDEAVAQVLQQVTRMLEAGNKGVADD